MTHTHNLVEARRLEFLLVPTRTARHLPPDILARQRHPAGAGHVDTIIARTDGLACTRCDRFIPEAE